MSAQMEKELALYMDSAAIIPITGFHYYQDEFCDLYHTF